MTLCLSYCDNFIRYHYLILANVQDGERLLVVVRPEGAVGRDGTRAAAADGHGRRRREQERQQLLLKRDLNLAKHLLILVQICLQINKGK